MDKPKNWDSLAAFKYLTDTLDKEATIVDAGGEYYSAILPQLRKSGYNSLTCINTVFETTRTVDGIVYVKGDITSTSFSTGSIDAVTCLSVIEHGVPEKPFFKEMSRILKPGGILFVD